LKRPSLSKHLDRVIDRLARVSGRVDLPEPFLAEIAALLEESTRLRESSKRARGAARDQAAEQLATLDGRLVTAARGAAAVDVWSALEAQASAELGAFRDRLSGAAWERAVATTAIRLLRDRFGLPTMTL
jgi:hypothetical protein